MPSKPYRRTCRPFENGQYPDARVSYIADQKYSRAPQQYIRAFEIIQKDLLELFDYVEPADKNCECYSYRILELFLRTCIEVEANCKAILTENGYRSGNWDTKDYLKLDATHRLSSYQVKFPIWHGTENVRVPFLNWASQKTLDWYQAYNQTKHNRHDQFEQANLRNLSDAIAGLVALLASQFSTYDFSYKTVFADDIDAQRLGGFSLAIGDYFHVKFPADWPIEQRYCFNWDELKTDPEPFQSLF